MSFPVDGAWGRQSVSIDGSQPFETQRVYWLQAASYYADLRVPFQPSAGTSCFSGQSGWDGDHYRWTHQLDLAEQHAAEDVGELFWDGDRLIERGSLGDGAIAYEEVWVRLRGDKGDVLALEAPGALHLQVGGHAITVVDRRPDGGSFDACYRIFTGDRWHTSAAIGDGAGLPGPGSLARRGDLTGLVPG